MSDTHTLFLQLTYQRPLFSGGSNNFVLLCLYSFQPKPKQNYTICTIKRPLFTLYINVKLLYICYFVPLKSSKIAMPSLIIGTHFFVLIDQKLKRKWRTIYSNRPEIKNQPPLYSDIASYSLIQI